MLDNKILFNNIKQYLNKEMVDTTGEIEKLYEFINR